MTWTYNKDGVIAVVSAELISTAIVWLEKETGISGIKPADLIPVVTSTRWVRVLQFPG